MSVRYQYQLSQCYSGICHHVPVYVVYSNYFFFSNVQCLNIQNSHCCTECLETFQINMKPANTPPMTLTQCPGKFAPSDMISQKKTRIPRPPLCFIQLLMPMSQFPNKPMSKLVATYAHHGCLPTGPTSSTTSPSAPSHWAPVILICLPLARYSRRYVCFAT